MLRLHNDGLFQHFFLFVVSYDFVFTCWQFACHLSLSVCRNQIWNIIHIHTQFIRCHAFFEGYVDQTFIPLIICPVECHRECVYLLVWPMSFQDVLLCPRWTVEYEGWFFVLFFTSFLPASLYPLSHCSRLVILLYGIRCLSWYNVIINKRDIHGRVHRFHWIWILFSAIEWIHIFM